MRDTGTRLLLQACSQLVDDPHRRSGSAQGSGWSVSEAYQWVEDMDQAMLVRLLLLLAGSAVFSLSHCFYQSLLLQL